RFDKQTVIINTTDNLTTDVRSGQIISFAYASLNSELTAILQYSFHEIYMQNFNPQDADTLMAIAIAEMKHLHILGDAMEKLGVAPKYVQYPNSKIYYDTSAVSQSTTPTKMLMDDIQGELNAIAEYKKMIFVLKNDDVAAIIQRIVLDEELHLETLKQMLEKYSAPKMKDDCDCNRN
ncbi:MAG: ferritin-like domain-containing protein, partial [Candidatus Fimimonas sp.]